MDRLHDTSLYPLPHPIRIDAVVGYPFETEMFKAAGVWEQLEPLLADMTVTTEGLTNGLPGLQSLAQFHRDHLPESGNHNLGTYVLSLTRARLRAHRDPIVQVTPILQAQLAATDLQDGLPVRFIRRLEPMLYIEFAQPNPLQVLNRVSGLHAFEGAYVGTYELDLTHPLNAHLMRNRALELDPRQPAWAVEFVVTGSPAGKANALDDASQNLTLFIQREDESLSDVLQRHLDYYASETMSRNAGMKRIEPHEIELITPIVGELAKVLLYMNLPDAERTPLLERTELERRLRRYGKLTAVRRAKLASVYDRTLLGPLQLPATPPDAPADPTGRSLRPHWRRGHFRRIRHGEGHALSRLGWIRPVLVNEDRIVAKRPPP